jgi:hypothetical protein
VTRVAQEPPCVTLARILPPVFPDRVFPVTDYGAVGDGARDCTAAFRQAVAACAGAGGGRVLVPDGQIEGICVGTTAAYAAAYYHHRPTDLRAMQGYGPVLMAGAEVMTMPRNCDIRRVNNTLLLRPQEATTSGSRSARRRPGVAKTGRECG